GRILADCSATTDAVFLIQGAQASLAYWGRLPTAIEVNGLTDRFIARQPLANRGRPGHERRPPMEYLVRRGVHFLVHMPGSEIRRDYAAIHFGELLGEIVTYDRALMERIKRCRDVEFVDFPRFLDAYIEHAAALTADEVQRDAQAFRDYYFDRNPDPARQARLQELVRLKRRESPR